MIIAASFDTKDSQMWENRGLFYGDGVFETMLSVNQIIPLWTWHKQRLLKSLAYLHMHKLDTESIVESLHSVKLESTAMLRLTVFRRQQQRGYQPRSGDCDWILSQFPYQRNDEPQVLALAEQRLSAQPQLSGLKHLNRLPQVLIAHELNAHNVDDLLVLDVEGDIIETTCQNIVWIKNGKLHTPNMKDCGVQGVALTWLKHQFSIKTEYCQAETLKTADGVMTANAVHGFRPIKTIKSLADYQINHAIYDKIKHLWQQQLNRGQSV